MSWGENCIPALVDVLRETTHTSDEYKTHIKLVFFNANLNITDNETTRTQTHRSIAILECRKGQQTNAILNVAGIVHDEPFGQSSDK